MSVSLDKSAAISALSPFPYGSAVASHYEHVQNLIFIKHTVIVDMPREKQSPVMGKYPALVL